MGSSLSGSNARRLCTGSAVLIAALVTTVSLVTAGAVAWNLSMLDNNQSGSIASTCGQGLQCS